MLARCSGSATCQIAQARAVPRSRLPVAAAARVPHQKCSQHTIDVADRRTVLLSLAGVAATASLPDVARATACEYQTAPNGLQWCDIVEGDGASPTPGSRIRAHYRGSLASNGAVFDSSYERGRPLTFQVGVGQVIRGWDQGILGTKGVPPMKAGGKRLLRIPSDLAYGQRGAGGVIPPGATLDFTVELLGSR